MILEGDCIERMAELDEASVDAIVTDPPYGLEFMSKEWDCLEAKGRAARVRERRAAERTPDGQGHSTSKGPYLAAGVDWQGVNQSAMQQWHQAWATEALRVLKPGGHLLAFGGTRTYHRLACAIEDAGFEIRDSIAWQHMDHVFCQCGSLPYSQDGDDELHGMRPGVPDVSASASAGEGADVQPPMQRQAPGPGVGEARLQGRGSSQAEARHGRAEESGVEGRRDVLAEEGQLPGDQVRPSAGVGEADGSQGRLHHGTPATDGAADRASADEDGSGPPHRPRPAEQRADELGALAVEWIAQGRGAWPGCPGCGKPLAPPTFDGPLTWNYGSGFPKSHDVSKAIDKAAGVEREVVGTRPRFPDGGRGARPGAKASFGGGEYEEFGAEVPVTAPATPEAQQWQGWGTALKPAHEPIVVARKPLIGTVAANVLEHGTGAINVDGCRIGMAAGDGDNFRKERGQSNGDFFGDGPGKAHISEQNPAGRWPANVALSHLPECERVGTRRVKGGSGWTSDDQGGIWGNSESGGGVNHGPDGTEQVEAWRCAEGCPVAELDRQSGELKAPRPYERNALRAHNLYDGGIADGDASANYGDTGGASRFFYTAKASRAERNAGLDGFEERDAEPYDERPSGTLHERMPREGRSNIPQPRANHHPTVKPIDLMRWLVRLVTPPGGTVLDPFTGSGTTGIAATLEGFSFIGIEREAEYAEIAKARLRWWAEHPEGMEFVKRLNAEAERKAIVDAGQLELL